MLYNQVRVRDLNGTSTFITLDTSSGNTNGIIGCRFVACRGNGVTVYDATKCPNFHILEIINCIFVNTVNCNRLGKIIESTFYSGGGIVFNILNGLQVQLPNTIGFLTLYKMYFKLYSIKSTFLYDSNTL